MKIIAKLLIRLYRAVDRVIRVLFGEVQREKYKLKPRKKPDLEQMRGDIYKDFLSEQPSALQVYLLELYLAFRHKLAKVVKRVKK